MARITRVRLENYKSIKFCDVRLEPLTVLVGKNGSGKSNFLDALAFTRDVLLENLENAIRRRGNFLDIARKNANGNVESFSITLEFEINGKIFELFFKVELIDRPAISTQYLREVNSDYLYNITQETMEINKVNLAPYDTKNFLGISIVGNFKENYYINFILRYFQLFYPNPEIIRVAQKLYYFEIQQMNSSHIDSMFFHMQEKNSLQAQRVIQYLRKINSEIKNIEIENRNSRIYVDFYINDSLRFDKSEMSDGTLNAWALLTTLFYQDDIENQSRLPETGRVLALEEPENSLHPTALKLLMLAIDDVLPNVQVLLTTHSPELLEYVNLKSNNQKVLVVESINGESIIDELDNASREVVQDEIFSLGELLSMDQLEPKSIAGQDRHLMRQSI
jgi:predicted ATPase